MKISIKEASQILDKTEQTVYNWIKNGKIEAIRENNIWKIEKNSIESILNKPAILGIDENIISKFTDNFIYKIKPVIEEALSKENKKEENQENELEKLKKENKELRALVSNLNETVKELGNKVNSLLIDKKAVEPNCNPVQDNPVQDNPEIEVVDQEKAEKWLRDNISSWIDEICPFKKADKRSWRKLAENNGEKISMNGKGFQSTRAYLHAIENWEACKIWARLKAKVALEYCKK